MPSSHDCYMLIALQEEEEEEKKEAKKSDDSDEEIEKIINKKKEEGATIIEEPCRMNALHLTTGTIGQCTYQISVSFLVASLCYTVSEVRYFLHLWGQFFNGGGEEGKGFRRRV